MCCGIPGLKLANKTVTAQRQCAVCVSIHGDEAVKTVTFCYLCKEWLCKNCERQPWNRVKAAVKSFFSSKK